MIAPVIIIAAFIAFITAAAVLWNRGGTTLRDLPDRMTQAAGEMCEFIHPGISHTEAHRGGGQP